MNELNRPLGLQPEREPKRRRRGNLTAAAALLLAAVAIGLAGYQLMVRDRMEVARQQTANAQGQAGGVAPAVPSTGPETAVTEEADEDYAATEGDGSGLTPLEPTGTLAVPKPRPPRAEPQEAASAHLPDPELLERGATGVIPKRSADGRRPMDVYAREPDTTGNFGVARVVLIVGGIGISQTSSQQAIRLLPPAATLGFAATGNSLARWMQEARHKGHELLLQIPMEAFGGSIAGNRALTTAASAEENIANLHWAMSRMTNYVGIMNYLGARFLGDTAALKPVFDEIAARGLLFVDDGTSGANRSEAAAAQSILPYTRAHVLLDGERTRQAIAAQIDALVTQAKRTGIAIGVSNGFPETIEMLGEFGRKANELGIEITPVSAIVSDPQRD